MNYSFPSIAIPESEKKKREYYMKWAQSICHNHFTPNWALGYNKMKLLYSFYLEGTGSDLTGYLQTAADGTAMPGIWTSQNSVKTRLRSLFGEMEERSFIIKARALNSEAQDRKREEQERLRVKRHLGPLADEIADETGVELESPEYVPQSDAELREYMDLTWKDKNVLILEAAVKWTANRDGVDEMRKRSLIDQLIVNLTPVCNEIYNGLNCIRYVDPLKFGFDNNATDDMIDKDSTYFLEVDYKPLAELAQRYGLSVEELQTAHAAYENGKGIDYYPDWACMQGQIVKWYDTNQGVPRGLVTKIVWRDYKELAHKSEEKEKGEYFQDVTGEHIRDGEKDKIKYNKIECWRQATLIGGQFLREWGECPNQPRNLSTLQKAESPYNVWANENLMGRRVSMAEQLIGLQLLKDIALYQLQIQMARAVGRVLVFDEAMFAEGQTKESTLRSIKADGVAFVNTKEYQQQTGNLNLFKDYDLGLSNSISQAIALVNYYDQQIDSVSGVSPERQGQIQGSSTSTGTTNAALIQSSMVTASLFKGFERFWSRVFQKQAGLIKIAWAGKEKFAPIIGDVGIDFLADNIDISLDEFDVVVQCLPPSSFDRDILTRWLDFAVQSDPSFLTDAMSIMLEPDTTVAIREYQRKAKLRKRIQAQEQQAQYEAEQQAQQAQQQHEQQMQMNELQTQQAIEGDKSQKGVQKQLIGSRTKLQQEKIKALTK